METCLCSHPRAWWFMYAQELLTCKKRGKKDSNWKTKTNLSWSLTLWYNYLFSIIGYPTNPLTIELEVFWLTRWHYTSNHFRQTLSSSGRWLFWTVVDLTAWLWFPNDILWNRGVLKLYYSWTSKSQGGKFTGSPSHAKISVRLDGGGGGCWPLTGKQGAKSLLLICPQVKLGHTCSSQPAVSLVYALAKGPPLSPSQADP